MAVELPVSLYGSSFDLANYIQASAPSFPEAWSRAQAVTKRIHESPEFQEEWHRLENETELARLESLRTGPHDLIVNPRLDDYHGPEWHRDHGLPLPPGFPDLPEDEYILRSCPSPFKFRVLY